MKGLKKSYKKSLAGLLAFCLTFTSLNSAAWAGEGLEFTDNTPVLQLHLDGQQLKEAAQEAIRDGFADPDSAVSAEDMALLDEAGQALDSKYEKLFTENTDGSVYEFTLEFGEEDFIPGSVELRAFVRAQSAENYELTGKEQIVFLYANHGEEAFVIATDVDGNTIPDVKVNAKASAVVEESLPSDKIEESTEETETIEEATEASDGTSEDTSVEDETVVNGTDVSEEETSKESSDATSEESADIDAEMEVDGDKSADGTETDAKSETDAKADEDVNADEDVKGDVVEEPAEEAAPAADSADDSDDEQVSVSALAVPMVAESERIFSDESLTNDIDGTDEEESVTVEGKKLDGKVYSEVSLSDESVAVAFVTTFDKLVLAGEEKEVTGEYTLTVAHNLTVDGKLYTVSDKVVLGEESFNEDGTFDLTAYAFEVIGAALVTDGQNYVIEKSNFDSNSRFAAQLKYELDDGYKLIAPEQETKGRSAGVMEYGWNTRIVNGEGVAVSLTGPGSLLAKTGEDTQAKEVTVTEEVSQTLENAGGNIVLTLSPEDGYGITSLMINGNETIRLVKRLTKGDPTIDIGSILETSTISGLNKETVILTIAVKYEKISTTSLEWSRSESKPEILDFKWSAVEALETTIVDKELVWDGRYDTNLNAYNNKSLATDYATWLPPQYEIDKGATATYPTDFNYEIRRFKTSFTLREDQSVNNTIRLFSAADKNKLALDDDVYIFVYEEHEKLDDDNFLDYLAFWGGTRAMHQEGPRPAFHGIEGVRSRTEAPLGYSLYADPDNIGKKLYELYHDTPEAGAGKTFVIDIVFGEFTSGGGVYVFDLEVVENEKSSTTVTINYYQDSVDGKFLGSETKKNVVIGNHISLSKEDRNAKKDELPFMEWNSYSDGIQIGGPYEVTGKNDVINVVYSKNGTKAKIIYYSKESENANEEFLGFYGNDPSTPYSFEEIPVLIGTRYDSIVDNNILKYGKVFLNKNANPNHYGNGIITNADSTFVNGENTIKIVYTKASQLYNLSYHANAGNDIVDVPDSTTLPADADYKLSEMEPQRNNHQFLGWSDPQDINKTLYNPGGNFTMPERDVELYAQWKGLAYDITVKHEFAPGEGSDDGKLPQPETFKDQSIGTIKTVAAGSVPGYVGILKDSEMKPGDLKTELSVEVVDQNIEVVFLYYKDTIGEGTGEETKNPDGIPDRFQIQFSYQTESETKGTVSGEIIEVKNRINANGLFDENTAVDPDAKNIVTQAKGLYEFVNWGSSNMGKLKEGSNPRDFVDVEAIRMAEFIEDTVFTAYFKLPNEIKYTVEFYYESEGVYPTSAKIEDISVRYASENTLVTVTDDDKKTSAKSGYTWDAEAPNEFEGMITGEKTVVLKVYFKQQFTVTYLPGDQGTFKEQVYTVGYGESIPSFAGNTSGKDGFEFTQWNKDLTGKVTGNLVIEAQWKSSGTGTPDPGTPDPGTPDPGTPDPGTPDLPTDNGNGGGGSTGGGGGGSRPGGSGGRADEDNGPGVNQDTTTIAQEEVPLAGLPTPPTDGTTFLIDDGEVPLAALPKTGDKAMASRQLGVLLSGLLIGLYATLKKKQANSNK